MTGTELAIQWGAALLAGILVALVVGRLRAIEKAIDRLTRTVEKIGEK